MKRGIFKKLLSLLLAMTIVLSLGLTAAFAEGEGITSVSVEPDNDPQTYDIKVTGDTKVTVDTTTNTYTVDNGSGPQGVNINTEQPVLVEVNNDVSGEGTFHKTDVPGSNVVVYVAGSDSESAPEVTVELNNHNVSAGHADNEGTTAGGTKGVIYGIYTDGSNVTVKEVGTVTATVTNDKVEDESQNNPSAQAVYAQGSTVNANTVQATGYEATAVRGYSGSEINVGTATATAVHTAASVDANNSGTKIEVNKAEATSTGTESTATAIQANDATVIAGSAAAETENGTAYGISVKECGGMVTADSVTATSNKGKAIAVEAKNRDTVVTVTNAVTATSTNGTANGIEADKGASVTAGSVEAASENGLAIAVNVVASDSEKPTSVIVREDVQSSETGVQVNLVPDAKEAEAAVVEIGGTLKVDEGGTPVLIGSGVTEDNIAITVWKVEIDGQQAKEGEIVKPADENATDEQKAAAKAVEESIQYIIQIKPEQQSNIRSSKATAKANETFTVTVTPPDGKKLDAVYTDEGEKIEATLNDDGTYSVTVRVGGGMLLSAKFSDKPVDPTPDPAPVPVPVPPAVDTGTAAANDWAAATVRLVPENGAYTVTLTTRVPTMTFLRQTLEKFAKYNDRLVIDTPYGSCEISLAELLNFNEKAVNFRIVITSTALEIYVNGELFRSIPLSDLT